MDGFADANGTFLAPIVAEGSIADSREVKATGELLSSDQAG